jgi:diguanylate cyclase (GGDEF)-like protein/PAS domain S-box-containing protein
VWLPYLVLGLLGILASLAPSLPEAARGVVLAALGLSPVAAFVAGIRMHRPYHPLIWYLFGAGILAFVAGDVTYDYYDYVLGADPLPSPADAFYLGGYALVLAALLLLARSRNPGGDRASLIDAAIVATAAGTLSWATFAARHLREPEVALLERALLAAYPLIDVLLLAAVVRFSLAPGRRSAAYYLLGFGLIALLVSDVLFGVAQLAGSYEGGIIDAGWLLFYVLWGTAALHPSMRHLAEPVSRGRAWPSFGRLAALVGVSLLAPLVLAVQAVRGAPPEVPVIVGGSVVLFSLVLLRMEGLLRALSRALRERERAQAGLRESEERFRQLFERSAEALVVHDGEGNVFDCNPQACRLTGYSREELLSMRIADLDPDVLLREERGEGSALWQRALAGDPNTLEHVVRTGIKRKDGATFPAEVRVSGVEYGGRPMILASTRDVTERKRLEDELAHRAFHDPLTGLPNRALFMQRLEGALADRQRSEVAVLFVDLDDFKRVNDSSGHDAGDRLLVGVARRLQACLGPGDTVARLGGDEFVVLLEDVGGAQAAVATAERIARALRAPFVAPDGERLSVTATIGISLSRPGERPTERLLRDADAAMYRGKEGGKDRHVLHNRAGGP